jgi:hypothetical protein
MATTHLYVAESSGIGTTTYHKVLNLWTWNGSAWVPVIKQWVWNGASWQLCYDSTPGPLATIVVSPSSVTLNQGDQQQFTAQGFDADGRVVTISPTWTKSTITDSITSTGLFTAGSTSDSGTVHATVGSISGSASYTVF